MLGRGGRGCPFRRQPAGYHPAPSIPASLNSPLPHKEAWRACGLPSPRTCCVVPHPHAISYRDWEGGPPQPGAMAGVLPTGLPGWACRFPKAGVGRETSTGGGSGGQDTDKERIPGRGTAVGVCVCVRACLRVRTRGCVVYMSSSVYVSLHIRVGVFSYVCIYVSVCSSVFCLHAEVDFCAMNARQVTQIIDLGQLIIFLHINFPVVNWRIRLWGRLNKFKNIKRLE